MEVEHSDMETLLTDVVSVLESFGLLKNIKIDFNNSIEGGDTEQVSEETASKIESKLVLK